MVVALMMVRISVEQLVSVMTVTMTAVPIPADGSVYQNPGDTATTQATILLYNKLAITLLVVRLARAISRF